jgi:signal transduction histidine kinase
VEAHGGEITVSSRVGEGSVFEVRLPASADSEESARAKPEMTATG